MSVGEQLIGRLYDEFNEYTRAKALLYHFYLKKKYNQSSNFKVDYSPDEGQNLHLLSCMRF